MHELRMSQGKKEPSPSPSQEPLFGRPLKPVFKKVGIAASGFSSQSLSSNGQTPISSPENQAPDKPEHPPLGVSKSYPPVAPDVPAPRPPPPVASRPANIPNFVIPTSSSRVTKPAVVPQQRTSPLEQVPQVKPVPKEPAPAVYDRIQPISDVEPQRSVDEEIVHLRQRVTSLESTVSTLQKELLHMKKLLERSQQHNGQPSNLSAPVVHI